MTCQRIRRPTRSAPNLQSTVVFDLETHPFSAAFRDTLKEKDRIKLAPKLRIGCTYDVREGTYHIYKPEHAGALIAKLRNADEIISFNGKAFDIAVLQRHCGLSAEEARQLNQKHTDLMEKVVQKCARRISLDQLSRLNLGDGKLVSGRSMQALNLVQLSEACKSDVRQTYQLYELWKSNKLQFPPISLRGTEDDFDVSLNHHHLLSPSRQSFLFQNTEEMTEGQFAEYLAGTWGILDDDEYTFVEL